MDMKRIENLNDKTYFAPVHLQAEDYLLDHEGPLHELFERSARLFPEQTALECGEVSFSYSELDQVSNRLANYLVQFGIGPGSNVGVYFHRSHRPIVAILALLKLGATYIAIDPVFPRDRIRFIAEECDIPLFLTDEELAANARSIFSGDVIELDRLEQMLTRQTDMARDDYRGQVDPNGLCYLIYTSGTTGSPKGVMAEHRHVYRYVNAFNMICKTGPRDRVYQGFSLSFDGSVEEIWMAFSNASTLVVPERDTPKFGDELGYYLRSKRISYLSTVPTLLSTIQVDIPSLKTIVLSGEVCPQELVDHWANDGLRLFNVYGPTETTVNTTYFECHKGRPISIGYPIPGYQLFILDKNLKQVPRGEKGELFIAGETVSRGYFKQPELTAQSFLDLEIEGETKHLFKTGDLVSLNDDGEYEYFGRIDRQVKIRGYRVELAEIESVLREQAPIRLACVDMVKVNGLEQLAAYVELEESRREIDRDEILGHLEGRLPRYMIPSFLETVEKFERLTSGKIDRRQLPPPMNRLEHSGKNKVLPRNALEEKVADVWKIVLGSDDIGIDDDFFTDLGGHSLFAAKAVTKLRKEQQLDVAIRDIYTYPSIRVLTEKLASRGSEEESSPGERRSAESVFKDAIGFKYYIVGLLQLLSIVLLSFFTTLPAVVSFILFKQWITADLSGSHYLISIFLILPLSFPLYLFLSVASKWLLIGRYKVEEFPVWSFRYLRFWFASKMQAISGVGFLVGTPVYPLYLRLMGAKVGKKAVIATTHIGCFDLVNIGNNVSIGEMTQINGYRVEGGMLKIGSATIGHGCSIGINSALGLNVEMGQGAFLDDQSFLPDEQTLLPGKTYRGSPAIEAEVSVPLLPNDENKYRPILYGLLHLLVIELLGLTLGVPAILSSLLVLVMIIRLSILEGIATAIVAVPVLYILGCLYIAAVKRILLFKVKPGIYSVYSFFYLRKWASDRIMHYCRVILLPLYTTIYLPTFLRLMGARVGKRAEVSVLAYCAPELIEMGDESFFADASIIGGIRYHRGHFELAKNKIGRRSFVGNGSVLPVGTSLGNGCLLGVVSVPADRNVPDNTDLLGSTAFKLPRRHIVSGFDAHEIFTPTLSLILKRCFIDGLRVLIPAYYGPAMFFLFYIYLTEVLFSGNNWSLALGLPAFYIAAGLITMIFVSGIKWMVMGEIRPVIKPLWSVYVWANEMINGLYESMMAPALSPYLATPFAAPLLRLIGCKIGKRSYIESTLFSEFDMVHIGDYAALNKTSVIQNHLFEDRIMKSSYIDIGNNCDIGNLAIVLYDTNIQDNTRILPKSLLMKGESLKANTTWQGIPTERVKRTSYRSALEKATEPATRVDIEGGIALWYCKRSSEDPNEHDLARELLKIALKKEFDFDLDSEKMIDLNKYGRPEINQGDSSIHFSISHAGDFVAVALREGSWIGFDLEMVDQELKLEEIDHCFSESERQRFNSIPEENQKLALLKKWCEKEAVSKLLGKGHSVDFSQLLEGISPSINYQSCTSRFGETDVVFATARVSELGGPSNLT
jgi:non-ribosomal peptide synthetase-like protein